MSTQFLLTCGHVYRPAAKVRGCGSTGERTLRERNACAAHRAGVSDDEHFRHAAATIDIALGLEARRLRVEPEVAAERACDLVLRQEAIVHADGIDREGFSSALDDGTGRIGGGKLGGLQAFGVGHAYERVTIGER